MGFLSKLFGGGGASKPEPTANERALADVSRAQYRVYKSTYEPLISQFRELSQKDRSATYARRNLASLARMASQAGFGRDAIGEGVYRATAGAFAQTPGDIRRAAKGERLRMLGDSTRIGMGGAIEATSGLADAARTSLQDQLSQIQYKMQNRQANIGAINQAINMAAMAYGAQAGGGMSNARHAQLLRQQNTQTANFLQGRSLGL